MKRNVLQSLWANIFLITTLTLPSLSASEIFRWKDVDGTVHYGDRPPKNTPREKAQIKQVDTENITGCSYFPLQFESQKKLTTKYFDKTTPPAELAKLKAHPLWNHFLSTKVTSSYAGVLAEELQLGKESLQRKSSLSGTESQGNITTAKIKEGEACLYKLIHETLPPMFRRLAGSPFMKYFGPYPEPAPDAPAPSAYAVSKK